MKVLDDPGQRWSACNPVTVTDRVKGRVWVFHARTKPGRGSTTSRPDTRDAQAWARWSDDNGLSWSEPTDLTETARDVKNWGGSFFGPGGAIQTRTGRLIVPLSRTFRPRLTISEEPAAYSDMTILADKTVGVLWERDEYRFITLSLIPCELLKPASGAPE